MAARVRKGDTVEVVAGKDKGRRGTVLQIYPKKNRVLVEGLNMVKKHQRPSQTQEGGILDREASVHLSNVMPVDPSDDKVCRVGFAVNDGVKKRVSKRTGTVLD